MNKVPLTLAAIALIAAGGGFAYMKSSTANTTSKIIYTTATVSRGDVLSSISASGTIEPEELIDVGSQVSGQILAFGKDEAGNDVDYCSVVTNGMLLAKIDAVTYIADLNVSRAQLNNAEAGVAVAKANLEQAQAKHKQAARDWDRATRIGVGNALSQSAYDAYEAAVESAKADVSVAQASIMQSEAAVVQAQASVEKAERNLSYCTITSPVNGVVIDRRVNQGQTVVSSMSASSLFLIAKDLRKVQIWVAVNEADIGQIQVGMPVGFTVDTFPELSFRGVVRRIRLNATITSNVVTYTVEVETDNADGTLLPYLTANVQFETAKASNALVVPARALRWRPEGASTVKTNEDAGVVHVLDDNGFPRPLNVKILVSNGTEAAIEADGLEVDTKVIIGTTVAPTRGEVDTLPPPSATAGANATKNPFMPTMPKHSKGGSFH